MKVIRNTSKNTASLSSSDLKRLEEAFFNMPKEKTPPPKKKIPFYIPALAIAGLILVSLFYFKFTVLIIPKIPETENNLLSSQLLKSINFSQEKTKTQFSQGVLYLSLDPEKPQEIILNVKEPINLEKNDIFLHLSLVNPDFSTRDLKGTLVVKDNKYFSNARNPETISLSNGFLEENSETNYVVPIKGENPGELQMNFAEIVQLRLKFLNLKDTPVSLLIREIKLGKKEDG